MVKYERRGYGKYVVIRHENGLETVYGHLSKQIVDENQYVESRRTLSDWVEIPGVSLDHIFILNLLGTGH